MGLRPTHRDENYFGGRSLYDRVGVERRRPDGL